MDLVKFKKGEVIFKQGEVQFFMYYIESGAVGIYANYGEDGEKQLSVMRGEEFLGEMGLVDSAPRSATAVALEDCTVLNRIDAQTFESFFKEKPAKILTIMQKLCGRVRRLTDDYMEACGTITEYLEANEKERKSESLIGRMKKFMRVYKDRK